MSLSVGPTSLGRVDFIPARFHQRRDHRHALGDVDFLAAEAGVEIAEVDRTPANADEMLWIADS
jgi:hypothetical protein